MGKKKSSSHKAKRSLSRLPKGLPVRGGGGSDPTANPFEQGGPQRRPKQFVHNRGGGSVLPGSNGGGRGRGGGPSSLLLALQQRQQVVQAERQASKKSNVFYDRRLTASTPQEQALQRLVKARHSVGSKRKSKFRLGDGDDDFDGGGGSEAMLTHRGKAISELSAADHVILSDTEEDYGHLEQLDTDLHFGGGALGGSGGAAGGNPYGPSGGADADANQLSLMSSVYARRKTELDDLILRRKIAKAEKLKTKEEQVETFDKFDDEYKELAGLLQFRDKRKQYSTDVDDEMAEWDREMNTLLLKRRVAATDRTKTEEEVAKDEADRLHELETKRLARMNGDFDDDDLSDVSVGDPAGSASASAARNQRPKHAEALDDDFDEGGSANKKQQFSMKFTADGLVKVDAQGNLVKESEEAGDSVSPSATHPVGTRVSTNYHAAEQLEGYSAWYEGVVKRVHTDEAGAVTYDIDYDDGDFEEGVQPQHVRALDDDAPTAGEASTSNVGSDDKAMKLKRQKAKEQARSSIPFVFEVPTTLDALHDMIATHAKTGEDASLIIRRIHVANSVKLDRRNAEKMQNFYDVLLRRMVAVGDAIYQSGDGGPELGRFKQLDSLISVLYLMAQDSGDSTAAVWGRRLGFFQSAHAKRLRDAELDIDGDDAPSSAWPSTGVFLALRALGHVFPVTDRRHHVVTPAILFLGQVISHTPIDSMNDLVMGVLFTGLLIEYNKEAKRIVPEALAFLGGVLRLFAPKPSDRNRDLFSHPALGAAASIEPFDSIRESATSLVVEEESALPRLSLRRECIDRTPSCAMAVLVATLELVTAYATAIPTCARECFAEVASALCTLQPRHKAQPLPKAVWSKLSTAVSAIERHEEAAAPRPPLQRRSAPTVVSIKSLAPRLESSVTSNKKRSRGDGNAVTTALRHELQRETKAAKRELQWDATLVEQLRRTEQAKRDEAASSKRHRAFAWLEQQQGELNQQVRQGGGLLKGGGVGAARAKARSGKLGMKKGGKL